MNYLKILGASGSKTKSKGTTSFKIYEDIIIDAGNIISTLGDDILKINHIFLTHSHSDHTIDLPFIIESFFEKRETPLTIYGSKETLKSIKKHTFNDEIWPDFSKINLLGKKEKSLVYKVIEENETINIRNIAITPIKVNHIKGSFGFTVIKNDLTGYLISGDTYENDAIWEVINKNKKIKSLIVECSFPTRLHQLAKDSKHYSVKVLAEDLKKLKREDLQVFIYHVKPLYYEEIVKEIKEYKILSSGGKILEDGDVIHIDTGSTEKELINQYKFEKIMEINFELSSELDKDKLFEMILTLTRELTQSEAGTLYIMSKDKKELEFKVVQNDPMDIHMGGTKEPISWDPLPLYLKNGAQNKNMVAAVAALEKHIINVPDAYTCKRYHFEGTKRFDKSTGYTSKSMLVIPLINHEDDVIGVLQLINKTRNLKDIISFNNEDEMVIKALSSQAAMALTNTQLISSLEDFLNAFVTTIAHAIDAKSKHTRKHISKVAKIANLIAKAIHDDKTIYKDVKYSSNDFRKIELAAWMHDIGKISTPEQVMDKSTKLEELNDGIALIEQRFEILKRDIKLLFLANKINDEVYKESIEQIESDILFLREVNIGSEYMDDAKIERVHLISEYSIMINDKEVPFLSRDEVKKLTIRKGTLTQREKDVMNNHAKLSYEMLATLPFPKKYHGVLDIAANHHEKLNGKGYPRGLSEKDLTLEDRIMILADIFEALTASDRPYKDAKKLSEVFKILSFMVKDNEIDGQLLKFFHESEVLQKYVNEELNPKQIDKSELSF